MKNIERIAVWGLLGSVLLLTLARPNPVLSLPAGPQAHAAPQADVLGPVDALTLNDAGSEPLELRSRSHRLAWGDAPHERSYSVAYVFIGKVLNKLMQSEDLQDERDRLMEELNQTEASYREQLDAIGSQLQGLDPESPDAQDLYQRGSTLYQEYSTWQQQAMRQRGQLDAKQLETAYRELIEAVEVVADRRAIDTVYRFIPTSESFEAENPDQAMMAIRLRTALRYPEDLDITDHVLQELSLEVD
ncbi:MAG: OmpH family outer membrane protein [Phycisphaerales bacterium]|nr:OmpH family outer membrane protein [Phycisphaerae bacterium]NNF44834.1 OmpH family outer membrane protein [Phycisphaerales bacterium]NNM24801.1 OmpH family outer membrane protein [Phycisphaerales bacterium]